MTPGCLILYIHLKSIHNKQAKMEATASQYLHLICLRCQVQSRFAYYICKISFPVYVVMCVIIYCKLKLASI